MEKVSAFRRILAQVYQFFGPFSIQKFHSQTKFTDSIQNVNIELPNSGAGSISEKHTSNGLRFDNCYALNRYTG